MTENERIKDEIRKRERRIQEIYDPTIFVINNEIITLQKEIFELAQQCTHDTIDENNKCIYCGRYFI